MANAICRSAGKEFSFSAEVLERVKRFLTHPSTQCACLILTVPPWRKAGIVFVVSYSEVPSERFTPVECKELSGSLWASDDVLREANGRTIGLAKLDDPVNGKTTNFVILT